MAERKRREAGRRRASLQSEAAPRATMPLGTKPPGARNYGCESLPGSDAAAPPADSWWRDSALVKPAACGSSRDKEAAPSEWWPEQGSQGTTSRAITLIASADGPAFEVSTRRATRGVRHDACRAGIRGLCHSWANRGRWAR
jgi:hypothetical protein